MIWETYGAQFPKWNDHDLIVDYEKNQRSPISQTKVCSDSGVILTQSLPVTTSGYIFRLFVSGHNLDTERTLQILHRLLEQSLGHPYTLKVIDIFKHPEQAEANSISATPTLIRISPQPIKRIVGELDDVERVLKLLVAVDV
ncbi:KaiB domain protein [Crinalium epipsammum PCC 9333]|uniref:KaiB domain protein n=1 Tax=Crinalium epipsammum PCC 9333 TaxID=1173022 RepID=K9VYB0_9CYAN|nr:KaiB domain protein [Crinalium epipsammum PCC 9333]